MWVGCGSTRTIAYAIQGLHLWRECLNCGNIFDPGPGTTVEDDAPQD